MERNGITLKWALQTPTRQIVWAMRGNDIVFVDSISLASAAQRQQYANTLCPLDNDCSLPAVAETLQRFAAEVAEQTARPESEPEPPDVFPIGKAVLAKTPEHIRREAEAPLESENLLFAVLDDIARLGVAGERGLALLVYLACTSRLLPRPLYLLISGVSASGKSFVVERVAQLMPPESVALATDATAQSLYYLPKGRLKNRALLTGERERQTTP